MKLSPWVWLVVGVALSLPILAWAYFHKWAYNMAEADMLNKQAEALKAQANLMPQAKKRVENATAEVNRMALEWQSIVAAKTPPQGLRNGGIDLSVNPYQLTVDTRKFRDSIQRAVNAQVRRGGITVVSGPRVPDSSDDPTQVMTGFFNYPAAPYPVSIFELGQVEVTGNYQQIMQNVRSWSSMPNYLAVASGLAIDGTGNQLRGTYNVVVVAFIRGDKLPPYLPGQMPAAATPPAQGGQPGAGGASNAAAPPVSGGRGDDNND